MRDDRVDASQRRGELGDGEPVHEGSACHATAGKLDGEHPARQPEHPRRERVLRVAGQPRVVNARDARLLLQPRRERRGGRRVALHPHGERGDAPQHEERGERGEGGARVHLDLADGVHAGTVPHDDAPEHVAVTRQVLRRGVDDEVRAVFERPDQVRRRERGIDDDGRTVAAGDRRECRQVRHDDRRVADRLEVEDPRRGGRDGPLDGGMVPDVDELSGDAEPAERPDEEALRRAVHRPCRDDAVAGRHEREEHRVDRGHPRREGEAGLGALELRDGIAQRVHRRVPEAAVRVPGVASRRLGHRLGERLDRIGRERRRLVDRDGGRALRDRAAARCGADRARGEAGHRADATPDRCVRRTDASAGFRPRAAGVDPGGRPRRARR